jgi:hypothetical protein
MAAPTLGELRDREQIRDLLGRLARAVDRVDADGIVACYTAESRNDYGSFIASGAEFAADPTRSSPDNVATNHLLGQMVIDLDGDVARCETYFHAVMIRRRDDELRETDIAGRYLDRLERIGDRWLIADRVVRVDWVSSAPTQETSALGRFGRGARWPEDLVYGRD